jgi:hypothetical protein
MEVTDKEDDDPSNNGTNSTTNYEKLIFNIKSFFNGHTNFNKSYFSYKKGKYSEFNLITYLITQKVTGYKSIKRNITNSVTSYRIRGVMGWQQKI